jgi:hypothetical protein
MNLNQAIWSLVREGPKQESINASEKHQICADAKGERKNSDGR